MLPVSLNSPKKEREDVLPYKHEALCLDPQCDGLYMLAPGSGTVRRCGPVGACIALLSGCGLVGVGVALLE